MRLVLDTSVILAFLNEEKDKDIEKIKKIFYSIKDGKHEALISTISISEIFAVFAKLGEAKKAVEAIVFLKEIGITSIDVTESIAKEGGIFKAKYSTSKRGFSYADAIILSTALRENADMILTYDPEFSGVKEMTVSKPDNV